MTHFPTRILLATDGSKDASLALRAAVDLSVRTGSELHVVHAWQPFPDHPHPSIAVASDSALYEREAQKTLFEQLDEVEATGGAASGAHLRRGRPVEVIADLGEELEAGLVVVGSRGLGTIRRLVMGSVSEGVVDLASRPVLVLRGGGDQTWPPSRIVVGDDGSGGAREAAGLATSMGRLFGAEVVLVRASPAVLPTAEASRPSHASVGVPEDIRAHHEVDLMERAHRLEDDVDLRPRIMVVGGEAASVLLEAAEDAKGREKPALVSVGRRGLGMMDRLRLGSVSTKVLRAAIGPVLVCPSYG